MEEQKVKHLAVILDGNRRYAKKKVLGPLMGHDYGAENVDRLLDWCLELGIKELTMYALSTENLKRDKKEVDKLFSLMKKWFSRFKEDKRVHENKVKIRFIGDRSLLPEDIQGIIDEIEQDTFDYDNYKVNFCIAYGGRLELVHAFNKLKQENAPITETNISKALWLNSEPDLVIRTGNAIRTSNFLPWQTAYSEWIFLEKLWPEFTKEDLIDCLKNFEERKRNFGK
jgi:tritrans,polycis-undecaprenyl-diphosphate synthase [geranylgeranyl-diphosphate specific]